MVDNRSTERKVRTPAHHLFVFKKMVGNVTVPIQNRDPDFFVCNTDEASGLTAVEGDLRGANRDAEYRKMQGIPISLNLFNGYRDESRW